MEAKGVPFFGPSVEFSSVPSIETNRILSYFNQFVSNSVHLLNKFALICDTKLNDLHFRLQDVEASLAILETKLASIPALETAAPPPPPHSSTMNSVESCPIQPIPPSDAATNTNDVHQPALAPPTHPEIQRFVKMLAVGVPLMAVEQKMRAEGYDPTLLSNNHPHQPSKINQQTKADDDRSSSEEHLEDSESD